MTPFSLGVFHRNNTLSWALAGFGADGWGLIDAGNLEEPLESALPRLRAKWPRKVRPHLGVPFGIARCQAVIGDRPVQQIISAERLDRNDDSLLVKIVPFGDDRLSVSLPRHIVADVIAPWRAVGIEPQDVEPLEIAWARAYPDVDALLHLPNLAEGHLVVFGDRHINAERLPNFSEGLESHEISGSIVEHIRQARGQVEHLQSAVLHGPNLEDVATADGDLRAVPCEIGGEQSPAWADAFVLALAAVVVKK